MATPLPITTAPTARPTLAPPGRTRSDIMAYLLEQNTPDNMIAQPPRTVGEGVARAAGMGLDALMARNVSRQKQAELAARNNALADALFPAGEGGAPDPRREMVAQLLETGAVDPSVFGEPIAKNLGFGGPPEAPTIHEAFDKTGRKAYVQWTGTDQDFGFGPGWAPLGGSEALANDKKPTPYTDLGKVTADEQAGILTPEQAQAERERLSGPQIEFNDIGGLRKEIQSLPSYKNAAQAFPIYRAMVETAPNKTRASDLNLVYGLGKIMDPTSVVREGEMIMVKDTASLPDWLIGEINRLNGGQALQEDTRNAILAEAGTRMKAYLQAWELDAEQYKGIVDRYGLNPADVLPDLGEIPEFKPLDTSGSRTGSGDGPVKITTDEEYDALPSGAEFIGPDGKLRKKP